MQRKLPIINTIFVIVFWVLIFIPNSVISISENGKSMNMPFNALLGSREAIIWIALSLFVIFAFTDIKFMTIFPALINLFTVVGTVLDPIMREITLKLLAKLSVSEFSGKELILDSITFIDKHIFEFGKFFNLNEKAVTIAENYWIISVIVIIAILMVATSVLSIIDFVSLKRSN